MYPSTRLALRQRLDRVVAAFGLGGDRIVAVLGALLLITYLAAAIAFPKSSGQIVVGDAKGHYVQLRSLVFDRDLDFRNEYLALASSSMRIEDWPTWDLTATAHVRNYMPVGPALLWLPVYVIVVLVDWLLALIGLGAIPHGYERSLQLVPGAVGVLATTVAAQLTWRMAARFTSRAMAVIGAVTVWLGSHALYYSLVSPAYSHAASMLTAALFFWYWLNPGIPFSVKRAAWLGALAGVCALMRWQDALLFVAPVVECLRWRVAWRLRSTALAVAGAAWLVAFAPQMAVWNVLYGQPFALPQGGSFMQWTQPHLKDVLVSSARGLFVWAPLLVPAMLGVASFAMRRPKWRWALLAILVATWYVNAAVADWWAGEAFGARRFLSLTPLFGLGLAVWMADRFWRIAAAGALVAANILLLLQYQLALKGFEAIAPYPTGFVDMWLARFVVPLRLVGWGG